MQVQVTKYDGSRQLFVRDKVVTTAEHFGMPRDVAETIADTIEERIYDGIPTQEILRILHQQAKKYRPDAAGRTNLRRALSLIRPKPDFEIFIRMLLKEQGYEVHPSQIVAGRCGEHEVDGIATKAGITYFVEVKHHYNYHKLTGLDEGRIARAVIEDLQEGFAAGLTPLSINRAMIICNTKLSDHAKRYAACRGIEHIGWGYPPGHDLQIMIEDKQFFPITMLKDMDPKTSRRLGDSGILTLKQLVQVKSDEIASKTGIDETQVMALCADATALLASHT